MSQILEFRCIIYVFMFKEIFSSQKYFDHASYLRSANYQCRPPISILSNCKYKCRILHCSHSQAYHFGHDIIYNSTKHSVYSHCRKYTESWHAKFRSLISDTSSFGVIEQAHNFPSLVKTSNYFRDTTDVRQSLSKLNLQQVAMFSRQKPSRWKARLFRIIIWTVHPSCGLCSPNHRKPRKREIFYTLSTVKLCIGLAGIIGNVINVTIT